MSTRPIYHFTAPQNWLNDPNGVCFHAGRYHLFYQHNPAAPHWATMHWGHASSTDLVTWIDEPIALVPTPGTPDEGGCFSGTFVVTDGVPTLHYTGYTPERQMQCVATADPLDERLLHWQQQPDRTLREPPPGVPPRQFRDPYVFRQGDGWCMVVGASLHNEQPACLLYRSDDGVAWRYCGVLFESTQPALGTMWECPSFFPVAGPGGERWVLTVSLWALIGAHVFVGRFEGDRFVPEWDGPLDVDAGSFAHLAMRAPDGRMLQWAWLREQREQRLIDPDGWAGAISVPRELGLDARQRLTIRPVAELEQLRGAALSVASTGAVNGVTHRFAGRHIELQVSFADLDDRNVGVTVASSPDGEETTRIVYLAEARRLVIERERSSLERGVSHQNLGAFVQLEADEALDLCILLDASVLEVYANSRHCLSTRLYPQRPDSVHGSVFVDGKARVASAHGWAMGHAMARDRA